MNSDNSQGSIDSIADVLGSVRKKGVRFWSEDGELRYKAPKGVLTQDEIERLRVSKGQVVALLEEANAAEPIEPRLGPRRQRYRAPLAFSQLAHWRLYQLGERRAIRQIASATRLRGRLNVDALRKSIAEVVCRHEALRTRIVVVDGVPVEEISESGNSELEVDDLTATPEGLREAEVTRIIEQHVLEPIDVAVGPLFGVRLVKLRDDEHVMIVAMEHMISDMFSLMVLLRDLFATYVHAVTGRALLLPTVSIQFPDFAVWQRSTHGSWIEKHGAYWNERLAGCRRLRFPEEQSLQATTGLGWGTVRLEIGRNLKAELREWCRLRRTTLVMSVFTAYVGLVLRWCNEKEAVFRYISDGRASAKIENTIGFFASVLYPRIGLLEDDNFVDLLNRITQEYCHAYERNDCFYIAAQAPRPEFTRNPAFNWVPQGSRIDLSALDGSEDAVICSAVPIVQPTLKKLELDHEPVILLYDTDDEVVGGVHFPLNRFSNGEMERFARNFMVFLRALLRQPEGRVKDIVLA